MNDLLKEDPVLARRMRAWAKKLLKDWDENKDALAELLVKAYRAGEREGREWDRRFRPPF